MSPSNLLVSCRFRQSNSLLWRFTIRSEPHSCEKYLERFQSSFHVYRECLKTLKFSFESTWDLISKLYYMLKPIISIFLNTRGAFCFTRSILSRKQQYKHKHAVSIIVRPKFTSAAGSCHLTADISLYRRVRSTRPSLSLVATNPQSCSVNAQ